MSEDTLMCRHNQLSCYNDSAVVRHAAHIKLYMYLHYKEEQFSSTYTAVPLS